MDLQKMPAAEVEIDVGLVRTLLHEQHQDLASQPLVDAGEGSALTTWCSALATSGWSGPSVWLHGDLHPGNLVVNNGQLTAVIDFGDLTAGDPAVDLAVAWMLWPEDVRVSFRGTINRMTRWRDEGVWRRARGWALSFSVAYLANSLDNPRMGAIGRRTIGAVLADT